MSCWRLNQVKPFGLKKAKRDLWVGELLEFAVLHSMMKTTKVVGMISVNDMDANVLVVSENGYGKRSSLEDYRVTNRGVKG
jgi:DNA gyrase/topoisomerase IV subunit A